VLPKTDLPTEFEVVGNALQPNKDSGADAYFKRLVEAEAEPRTALLDALGDAGAAEAVRAEAHKQAEIYRKDDKLDKADVDERNRKTLATAGRLGVVSLSLLVAWLPLVTSRWWKRRALRAASKQCPRCLSADNRLKEFRSGQMDRHRRPIKGFRCDVCTYQFQKNLTRFQRHVFPTIGMVRSGKTRWLLSLYHKVGMNELPRGATVLTMPLALNEALNRQVHESVILGNELEPTRAKEAVEPLVFYCEEKRTFGIRGTRFLVNLFDYSGEIMSNPMFQNILQRAIECNGCLLFLDPMNQNLPAQYHLLTEFLNVLATYRGRTTGEHIDIPVAVCVTKIDWLADPSAPVAGREWLAELERTATWPLNLRTIRWRSNYVASAARQIFLGGDLERLLQTRFGNRVMLFPMSAIGIDENCLDYMMTSPQQTPNMKPFGILEPFYWLLHMNGYKVLE
jgi:hypothetical protein